jgi:hypothetical protein
MGDIPHGWAAAELIGLVRDMCVFEADEDGDRHLYVGAGLMPHWFADGDQVIVSSAPTTFGTPFGYRVSHDAASRTVRLDVTTPVPSVRMVWPCRFGHGIAAATADGQPAAVTGTDVQLPAGTASATVHYT